MNANAPNASKPNNQSIRALCAMVLTGVIAFGLGGCVAPVRPSLQSQVSAGEFGATVWPAQGSIVGRFDVDRNKGIDIAGEDGAPVLAVADGRVVYVGSKLRGYGNLIIVKHNSEFLTAYAHNRRMLVQENDVVLAGQQIAEMGSSDAATPMLHFEVRRAGKPVDPEIYLRTSMADSSGGPRAAPARPLPEAPQRGYGGRVDMRELKGLMPSD